MFISWNGTAWIAAWPNQRVPLQDATSNSICRGLGLHRQVSMIIV